MKIFILLALSITLTFANHHEEKQATTKKSESKDATDPKMEARRSMFEASKKMFIEIKKKQMTRHQAAIECAEKAQDQEALKKCREESRMARDELKATNKANRQSMKDLRSKMREKLRNKKQKKKKADE